MQLPIFITLFLCALTASANEMTITGTVLDTESEPVIGASVVIKGTKLGVATDLDGNFTIKAPAGAL